MFISGGIVSEESSIEDIVTDLEKEPLLQSARFRTFVAGLVLEVLVLFANKLGLDLPLDLLQTVATSIAVLFVGFIYSRTQRNTAV